MILFDQIVYGPVSSRRLGVSLGVNLSPTDGKRCTFDCIYCECGLNKDRIPHLPAPSREAVREALSDKLLQMNKTGARPDVVTFSGNGEPTMHPDFGSIIDDTLTLRDRFAPEMKVAVLSNSTMLHKKEVIEALCRVDECLMKLDAAQDGLIRLIDQPAAGFTAGKVIEQLQQLNGKLTIQTIFLRGDIAGKAIDNTRDEDVEQWVEALRQINPKTVRIYTIDRETPVKTLHKVPVETLEKIAARVREAGFTVSAAI